MPGCITRLIVRYANPAVIERDWLVDTNLEKNGGTASLQNRPWLTAKDLGEMLIMVFITPLSWIVPAKLWKTYSYPIALLISRIRISNTREKINNIRKIRGDLLGDPQPGVIEINRTKNVIEQKVQYLREYGPGGWKPVINVRGIEFLENALHAGRGAVLWIAPFFFNNLVVKKGLYQSAFPVSHLSAYNHGPSLSRLGIRFVNSVYINVENKYLDERIVIEPARDLSCKNAGTNLAYIKRIEKCLKSNCLVSISCQPDPALEHQGVVKRILNGKLLMATGAPALALSNGSPLIPVFTIHKSPDNFEIVLEDPLKVPDEGSRQKKVERLLDEFVELTEKYTMKYPVSFRPWHDLTVD